MIFRRLKPTSLVEGCWQPHELRPERQGAFINWKIGGVDTPRSSLDWVPCSDGEGIPNCKMRGRGGRGKDRPGQKPAPAEPLMLTRRSRAREVALQLLYQHDVNPRARMARPAVERFVHDRLKDAAVEPFTLSLYDGVLAHAQTCRGP